MVPNNNSLNDRCKLIEDNEIQIQVVHKSSTKTSPIVHKSNSYLDVAI